MMKKIAERLQAARKSVGLNQNQVAESLLLSRGKLISIEKGEGSIDITLLGRLAHLYGYSLSYFLDDVAPEKDEISFAFRALDLNDQDAFVQAWARRILQNMKALETICEEAGI